IVHLGVISGNTAARDIAVTLGTAPVFPSGPCYFGVADLGIAFSPVQPSAGIAITASATPNLVAGDRLLAIDGHEINVQSIYAALGEHGPGDVIKLDIVRAGASRTVEAMLGC